MTHGDIVIALAAIRPNAKWVLRGDDLAGLQWLDDTARPTDAEIIDGISVAIARQTIAAIKAEARRRILERFPEWKQANIQAREGELHRIQVGLMRGVDGELLPARVLTEVEIAEEIAIGQAWAWIKAVRAASDDIEGMETIPADYADDARWPA